MLVDPVHYVAVRNSSLRRIHLLCLVSRPDFDPVVDLIVPKVKGVRI